MSRTLLNYYFLALNRFFPRLFYGFCFLIGFIEPVFVSVPVNFDLKALWTLLALVHVLLTLSSLVICSMVKHFLPRIRMVWYAWFGMDLVEQRLDRLIIILALVLGQWIHLFLEWFILFLDS